MRPPHLVGDCVASYSESDYKQHMSGTLCILLNAPAASSSYRGRTGGIMHDTMFAAVVTRKWQLAQGYHAVEIEAQHVTQLGLFDDGAIVDIARDTRSNVVRSHPLWRNPSRHDSFILGIRQEATDNLTVSVPEFSWDSGDEVCIGTPRNTALVMDGSPRYIFFSAGIGVIAIAGAAKRLVASGRCLEIHNFAQTPERAVFRSELDSLRGKARVCHKFGLSEEEIANAISHAVSPTHANTQVICSGPPSFMTLVERQATEWVYRHNVHKIILGERKADE
jgi:ferredoxin-NADP reductase